MDEETAEKNTPRGEGYIKSALSDAVQAAECACCERTEASFVGRRQRRGSGARSGGGDVGEAKGRWRGG